jgi:hypothetical protein
VNLIPSFMITHAQFGLDMMSGPDAVLWSVLGILLGVVLVYITLIR